MDQVIERIKQLSNLSKYIMLYEKFDKKTILTHFHLPRPLLHSKILTTYCQPDNENSHFDFRLTTNFVGAPAQP